MISRRTYQGLDGEPGAIRETDAPRAVPGAVRPLLLLYELEAALYRCPARESAASPPMLSTSLEQ